jgi:serine/threonine-protein kinase SRPK3
LGPPPPEFLARNPSRKADFWDEKGMFLLPWESMSLLTPEIAGNWLGLAPIPDGRTMEALETRLEDKPGFLQFIRRALTWMPEKRATAKELLQDLWLRGEKA